MFITGWGRAGFHWSGRALTQGRGGIFRVISVPPASGAHPHSFPGQAPFVTTYLRWGPVWGIGGAGARAGTGAGNAKKDTRPRPLSGAERGKGPRARIFGALSTP